MRSPWLIVLFLCLSASVNAIVPLPGSDDIQLGFNTFNVTHQRAATHFIMSGYQTTSFRSEDCDIKINGQDAPFQATIINWLGIYWGFSGSENEKMHVVVEGETRGWVGFGFTDSGQKQAGAEVVIGWIRKSDVSSQADISSIKSYRLSASGWSSPTDNSKAIPIQDASVCQTREGRTIIKFTRKCKAGKHPVEPWIGSYGYSVVAVGDEDGLGSVLDHAEFSMPVWQSKTGPDEPEGWSFRWIMSYTLLVFHIVSWILR